MYFCADVELMAWEPGIFAEAAFTHQTVLKTATASVSGTTLTLTGATFDNVLPGMVVQLTPANNTYTQPVEIVQVIDSTHATISMLRGRSDEALIPPLVAGTVGATVVTFRPQIAAVGDTLLSRLGVCSSRDLVGTPAYSGLSGFKPAAIFGTLAAIYRTLVDEKSTTSTTYSKRVFYEGLAQAARETISGFVDRNGDGVPDTLRFSGIQQLIRV